MHEEKVAYNAGKTACNGYMVYDSSIEGKRPAVLVVHAWMGQDDFARQKAWQLAKLGYVGFAADIYGNGVRASTQQEAEALMTPLFFDRCLLRERVVAAYEALRQQSVVDTDRMGTIGFCFGGLTAIELLRSGANLRGVVSFHAVLANARGNQTATVVPIAEQVHGSLLVLHGHEDPSVSREDIERLQSEMNSAGVDWQMHLYSHTVHAFTNPAVSDYQGGLAFNEKANNRSWQSMRNFFGEVFS
ncbi:MAG: dienelactone hydrolase family protein [Parachlamydia sp.]|nr:dienelactone hydrolase family protein [Parachlamydia sp.]